MRTRADDSLGARLHLARGRGRNDDEIVPLLSFARSIGAELRFIEYMPIGAEAWERDKVLYAHEILESLETAFGPLGPSPDYDFSLPGAMGVFLSEFAWWTARPLWHHKKDTVFMDGLKKINDTHGHFVGAHTIATVGRRLGAIVHAAATSRLRTSRRRQRTGKAEVIRGRMPPVYGGLPDADTDGRDARMAGPDLRRTAAR